MSNVIQTSRIPWLAACGGKRVEYISGCSNGPDICAVRARGLCWAEKSKLDQFCLYECANHYAKVDNPYGCVSGDPQCAPDEAAQDRGFAFRPTVHPEALDAVRRLRKPATLAWNLGGDAWCDGVDPEWRRAMFGVMQNTPQHTHITLTKCPTAMQMKEWPNVRTEAWYQRWWYGVSCCGTEDDIANLSIAAQFAFYYRLWVSFEPLMYPLGMSHSQIVDFLGQGRLKRRACSFIVIGGLSDGNGRIIPPSEGGTKSEWIAPIIEAAAKAGCKIFLKNLRKDVITQIINPRTGRKFESMFELRELPDEWIRS